MWMLDIEEWLFGAQFVGMLLQELFQAGYVPRVPVCTDEVVSVDGLHPYGGILFAKAFLPRFGRPPAYCLCHGFLGAYP